ncbi:MAG: ABC transporter permease [bacterium]
MRALRGAFAVEWLKVRRSKVPWITAAAFGLAPLFGGLFMIILKDPQAAESLGLLGTKAQVMAGTADWSTYLGLLGQSVGVGGIIVYSIGASWVFGREWSDGSVTDLLALPTPRGSIVTAKFAVLLLWSTGLTLYVLLLGLAVGGLIGLPGWSAEVLASGLTVLGTTALITVPLIAPIALIASAGRGYLAPIGAAILFLVIAQILGATGWGPYFPWTVPALHSGMIGPRGDSLTTTASYLVVAGVSLAGLAATFLWWRLADQTA